MKKREKIKFIGLGRLNNAESLNFFSKLNLLIGTIGADALGILAATMTRFQELLNQFVDVVSQTLKAEESERMAELDVLRDKYVVYLLTTLSNVRKSPDPAAAEAGAKLYAHLGIYRGIDRLPNEQETQQIRGLLVDARKPDLDDCLTKLDLKPALDALEAANDEYDRLTRSRTQSRALGDVPDGRTLRLQLQELYEEITDRVQAKAVLAPSEEVSKFIATLNQRIDETVSAYNLRLGMVASARRRKAKGHEVPSDQLKDDASLPEDTPGG